MTLRLYTLHRIVHDIDFIVTHVGWIRREPPSTKTNLKVYGTSLGHPTQVTSPDWLYSKEKEFQQIDKVS